VIVVDRRGTRQHGSEADFARLRAELDRTTCVLLPGFLDASLLGEAWSLLEGAKFEEHRHGELALDQRALPGPLGALLSLVLNDPPLLAFVSALAGSKVDGFEGRVYRMLAGAGHFDTWHSDAGRDRRVAISINLQRGTVPTAPLQIRRRDSETVLHEVVNATPGDAVLFRVDDVHVHRIKPMEGAGTRIACAGWFYSGAGMRERLQGLDLPRQ